MRIENKRLKTIIIAYVILYCVVVIAEVIPRLKDSMFAIQEVIKIGVVSDEIDSYETNLFYALGENKLLKNELHNATAEGSYSQRVSEIIAMLGSLQRKSSLEHLSVKPLDEYTKNELSILPFELSVQGSYKQIYEFIGYFERSQYTVLATKIHIQPVDAGSTILHANLYFDLYMNL